jgi:uncharacterized protein YaaQ
MKLITAIVQNDDANKLISALREHGFSSTKMSSTGGFLSSGNTTVISGVEDDMVDEAIEIITIDAERSIEEIFEEIKGLLTI